MITLKYSASLYKLCILAASALLMQPSSRAAQVNSGNTATGNAIGLLNGTLDPVGSLIRIGAFPTLTAAQIKADQSNPTLLDSNFVQFATTTVGAGNPLGAGSASNGYWTASSVNTTTNNLVTGQQIYYWIFNSTTLSASTQYGVFTAPSNPNWLFPADIPTPGFANTDLSNVPNTTSGIVIGSFGTGTANGLPEYNLAAVVPEPSSFVYLGGASVCAIALIRRRKMVV